MDDAVRRNDQSLAEQQIAENRTVSLNSSIAFLSIANWW